MAFSLADTLISLIASILGPQFLISRIEIIAIVLATMVLVVFDDFVSGKLIFPFVDRIKEHTFKKLTTAKGTKEYPKIAKYAAEFIATILFIIYFYWGYLVLSEFIFTPILTRLSSVILPVLIILFLMISFVFNNKKMRKKFLYD